MNPSIDFTYKDPKSGQIYRYGDPTINREAILGRGLEFVSGPINPNQKDIPQDPLSVYRYAAPTPTGGATGGAGGAAGAMFQPGGIYGDRTPLTPEEETAVREKERSRVQASIDAINELAQQELSRAAVRARGREGAGRAIAAATGTMGSPTETLPAEEIRQANEQERRAIEAVKEAKVQEILTGVENRAIAKIKEEKEAATKGADAYISYLSGLAEQSRADMQALATAQADLSLYQKRRLIEQSGYDEKTFDQLYTGMKIAAAPKGVYINKDKPIISGSKAIYFKQKPDGTIAQEVIDVGINMEGTDLQMTIAPDGTPLVFNKKTGEAQIAKGFKEGQFLKPEKGTGTIDRYGGAKLSSSQKDDIATMDTVKDLATQLTGIDVSTGGLTGVGAGKYGTIASWLAKVGIGSQEGQHVRDLIGNIQGTIAKLRGGTSFTPNEQALLDRYTPTVDDADWQSVQKLKDLIEYIDTKKKNIIEASGGSMQNVNNTAQGETGGAGTDTVRMSGPDGEFDVPAENVEVFKQNGYTEI